MFKPPAEKKLVFIEAYAPPQKGLAYVLTLDERTGVLKFIEAYDIPAPGDLITLFKQKGLVEISSASLSLASKLTRETVEKPKASAVENKNLQASSGTLSKEGVTQFRDYKILSKSLEASLKIHKENITQETVQTILAKSTSLGASFSSELVSSLAEGILLTFEEEYFPLPEGNKYLLQFGVEGLILKFVKKYTPPPSGTHFTLRFGESADTTILSKDVVSGTLVNKALVTTVQSVVNKALISPSRISRESVELVQCVNNKTLVQNSQIQKELVERLPNIVTPDIIMGISHTRVSVVKGSASDLPTGIGVNGFVCPYAAVSNITETHHNFPWGQGEETDIHRKDEWGQGDEVTKETDMSFVVHIPEKDNWVEMEFKNQVDEKDVSTSSPYHPIMYYEDQKHVDPFATFFEQLYSPDNLFNFQNFSESLKDTHVYVPLNQSDGCDKLFKQEFQMVANNVDTHHATYWGEYWYSLWCTRKYFPWMSDENVKLVLKTDVPIMNNPEFIKPGNPRCPFDYWYSGPRDNIFPPIIPIETEIVPTQKVYYMLNTAYITRVSDNKSIPFRSCSISVSREDYAWNFSITVTDKQTLELLKPSGSTFIDAQIHINGWEWTCKIESWRDTSSFEGQSYTVSGHSPSIEIGDPYLIDSLFQNEASHGGQIVQKMLEYTGWTAEWKYAAFNPYTEWLIPAKKLNIVDTSKIGQIRTLTNSVNAFIQTVPNTKEEKKLIIQPKYKVNPLQWDSLVPDVQLNRNICLEVSEENSHTKPLNSVILTTDNRGIVVNATLDGTAGDSAAPMCVDSYLTTQQAARERARHIFGASGHWLKTSLSLFSLMPPSQAPGLLTPGKIVGLDNWKGQVTETAVTATWDDSSGLTVSQQIEVERRYE
jgi:hypothetical protein